MFLLKFRSALYMSDDDAVDGRPSRPEERTKPMFFPHDDLVLFLDTTDCATSMSRGAIE